MSNFLIFKAAFNNSATPAIGTYTAEGATALFTRNTDISPDYYLYNTADGTAVQWFVPTAETTDFEFVADILTRDWNNRVTYFIIADSTGTTRLRMWSQYTNWDFENSDSIDGSGSPEYIGTVNPATSGGFEVFHQFRVRVRKLTASSSSVEVYVDGTLKLTATAGAALITCAKIGFVGGVGTFGPGTGAGVKNAYVYDLSGGEVIDRGVLSGTFNRFISWMKSKFALKSDIPTVNNAALTIQKNGTNVATFTANQSTAATANITVPTAVSELTNDSGYLTSSSNLDASKLTSGTVDIARLPQGALERLVKVANEAARYALTTADVQLGDTVQQLDTGIMYVVTDTDHLDSAAGYTEYTAGTAASVPWSGVTGKPTLAAVATSGAYSDLTGTPTIPTVNDATLTIQQNGTTVDTFTANSSSDKTVNIQCVDLENNQTVAGNKEFTGTTTAHDLVPSATDTYNFGSSTAQWNNLYAKNYYYNGVAWGLDQANIWNTYQTIKGYYIGNEQSTNGRTCLYLTSNRDTVGQSGIYITKFRQNRAQGAMNPPDVQYISFDILENSIRTNSALQLNITSWNEDVPNGVVLFSTFSNAQLGASTNKWKTLNGINPGALSLPGTFVNIDTTNWVLDGSNVNIFTPASDGWLGIQVTDTVYDQMHYIFVGRNDSTSYYQQNALSPINALWDSKYHGCVFIPVIKNVSYDIRCICSSIIATFYPCQGNV
jgi:hypothetical protein